jgi:hypothetical protein
MRPKLSCPLSREHWNTAIEKRAYSDAKLSGANLVPDFFCFTPAQLSQVLGRRHFRQSAQHMVAMAVIRGKAMTTSSHCDAVSIRISKSQRRLAKAARLALAGPSVPTAR